MRALWRSLGALGSAYRTLGELKEHHRGFAAFDRHGRESLGWVFTGRKLGDDGFAGQDLGVVDLGELLNAGGEVHGVADDGVLSAQGRADAAGDDIACVQADADASGRDLTCAGERVNLGLKVEGSTNGGQAVVFRRKGGSEDGEKAVP